MNGFNRVFLMGYLGANPEMKTSKGGKPYVRLSVATHHNSRLENGEKGSTTTWHRVTVWGKRAETCHAHLQKGAALAVEGYLSKFTFDRDDGAGTGSSTSVVAREVHFLGKKRDHSGGDSFLPAP